MAPKTLLLLPGLDGTGNLFTNFVSALPPTLNARIIKYPADHFLSYTELLNELRESIPTEPFVALAESFSTPLVLKLAATRLPNLAGLIICAGFITNPVSGWLLSMKPLVRPFVFRVSPPDLVLDYFLIGARAPRELREAVRHTLRHVSPQVMVSRIRAVMDCDARDELARVSVPMLYLQAEHDRLVKKRSFEEIRKLKGDVTLASISGPHFLLQREAPKAADLVVQFVSTL